MFETYDEVGGFCLLDWVVDADDDQYFFRMCMFMILCMPLGTALNLAWIMGIRRKVGNGL